jgi:glycosyltransferase involved in cell wall biosynthesis
MRPLKIALVSQFYWLESRFHYEGEGGVTRQLAEAVAALGHEVVVLTQSSEVRKLKKIEIGTLETWAFPRQKSRDILTAIRDRLAAKTYSYRKAYSDARNLRDFLARRGPFDAIWAHSESPDGLVVAIAAKLGVKLPPVLLQIQALRQRFEKGKAVFIDKKPLGLAFRRATRILATSELVVSCLPRYAGPGLTAAELQAKVRVVYPNIQRAFIEVQESPSNALPDRVLFLGALSQVKGALVFLRAMGKTEAAKRSSTFALIGDFVEFDKRFIKRWDEAREAARKVVTGAHVEYLGRVSAAEVIRQIQLAQVVVVPSLFDPFPRVVMEALVLGRPVITTEQVGSASYIKTHQCGIVVAPNDPDTLARAIDVALSPLVSFTKNAERVGHSLGRELSPEAIARMIAYHLSRIVHPPGDTPKK